MQTNDTMVIISTNELKKCIGESGIQVIDIRPVEAYNGWKLRDEPRGGHIKGAMPITWDQFEVHSFPCGQG